MSGIVGYFLMGLSHVFCDDDKINTFLLSGGPIWTRYNEQNPKCSEISPTINTEITDKLKIGTQHQTTTHRNNLVSVADKLNLLFLYFLVCNCKQQAEDGLFIWLHLLFSISRLCPLVPLIGHQRLPGKLLFFCTSLLDQGIASLVALYFIK